jgi:hypothetical protein
MFCPICKSEYRIGYTVCKDCNVHLVHELPPESESEYVEYEEILSTHSQTDIVLIKSILDAEGITYFFQGEYVSPYVMHAIPVRLMVNKDQVAKAVEALKELALSFTVGGSSKLIEEKEESE